MKNKSVTMKAKLLLLLSVMLCAAPCMWAETEVLVKSAGTLSTLLGATDASLKIAGSINGTDIKFLRGLINAGKVNDLNLSEVRIVAGGEAYFENLTTEDDVIGKKMFTECANLHTIELPATVMEIGKDAFSKSGLRKIDIPGSVSVVDNDAFAYCENLTSVVIGFRVSHMGKGAFYRSPVQTVCMKPLAPPSSSMFLFSSRPTIKVYTDALEEYKECGWERYGNLTGALEATCPQPEDAAAIVNKLREKFFEDAACTVLREKYMAMSDKKLSSKMRKAGMPDFMVAIALKIKNNGWAAYEKDFRIQNYKAYSDAAYWNRRLRSTGGSYMGNPTGIYCNSLDPLYVFVDTDVPEGATLYLAGCADDEMVTRAKTGARLSKGLNIVYGRKDALYYVVYTADTRSQTKKVSEWPEMKIYIEGGVVNGYYDAARKNDKDYRALLDAATHEFFTIKGSRSLFNFRTSSYKAVWPSSVERGICWFDSLTIWQQELMGYCESVANGSRAHAPYNLTGGEAITPAYYNNPNFAIEGNPEDAGYANSTPFRTAYNSIDCIRNSFDVDRAEIDEWCAGHECGHNNQGTINLEGGTEVSNNLFSNVGRFLFGRVTSVGSALSVVMNEYADRTPYYVRQVDSQLRMYYQLYLYYHQARKNTSFYPDLFKALREDPLDIWGDSYESALKFVRKVCEVAQEDLTEFFTVWGFFEPFEDMFIEDYGPHRMTVRQEDIDRTKAEIAKYPKKNRTILFIEDRADYLLTNDIFSEPGQKRRDSWKVGQFADLGQFTDYLPGACAPSKYTYIQSDSLYCMSGTGGVGFIMLDKDGKLAYAANAMNFCIPSSIGCDFTICSIDADGTMHETKRAGEGAITAKTARAGALADVLPAYALKATVSGNINAADLKYVRTLVYDNSLTIVDLSAAKVVADCNANECRPDAIGKEAFHRCLNLKSIILPNGITAIGKDAFSRGGLSEIIIPDKVATVGEDAFAYCKTLKKVTIGSGIKALSKGAFYDSPVKDVYVKAAVPPAMSSYVFSSKPVIHVSAGAVEAYKASAWAEFGTIVGDLDDSSSAK